MKTLYISDLDGTLLHPNVMLSKSTIMILNKLMSQGLLFSIATARSIASVKYILKDLNLTLPIILMNGSCIYDPLIKDYINIEALDKEEAGILLSMIEDNQLKGFLYTIDKGRLSTYYEHLSNPSLKAFFDERVSKYNKVFTKVDKFSSLANDPIVYFTLMDHKENLEEINLMVSKLPNINSVFYKDNYSKDMWYLEIYSKKASKYHAVKYLRSYLSLDKIIGFGDNQNDIPLFEACDKSYAVDNAIEELKHRADGIIGKNSEDAVANWLNQNMNKVHD